MPLTLATKARLFKLAGMALAVPAAMMAAFIAINRFDEPLSPDTQAWINYPVPHAPERSNGYLALLALDAQADRPLKPGNVTISFTPACKDDCDASLLAQASMVTQLTNRHAQLVERYDAMLESPAYSEGRPLDGEALAPRYALAKSLGLLHLGRAAMALEANDASTAYRQWARQQRFWQQAAAGSMTLDGLLQAATQLAHGQAVLAGMLRHHPESASVARQYALPVLQSPVALVPLFSRALVRQFQLAAQAITGKVDAQAESEGRAGRLYLLFYQRNASLNLANRMFRNYMAQHGLALDGKLPAADPAQLACRPEKNWLAFANQYGRHLICMARLDYRTEHQRIVQVDAGTQSLKSALAEKQ